MESQPGPTVSDIAEELAQVLGALPPRDVSSPEYAEWSTTRLVFAAALLERAFTRQGYAAAYVGGGVLQFHLGGEGYQTGDLDLVVAQRTGLAVPRATLHDIMSRLSGRPSGERHWVFGHPPADLLVEVPSHELPLETDRVILPGDLILTMDAVEHVITGRITEFHNTGNADHALQAIHALRALRGRLDRERLERCIVREGVRPAAELLEALVDRSGPITAALVAFAYDILRGKHRPCDLRDPECGPARRRR